MLIAKKKGVFSRSYDISDANGELIVELSIKGLSLSAHFTFNKFEYEFKSVGMFSKTYEMYESGKLVGSAELISSMRSDYAIDLSGRKLMLEKQGILSKDFHVLFGKHTQGSVYPKSAFSPLAFIDLPADWPLPYKLFIFWLAVYQWIQMEAAVS